MNIINASSSVNFMPHGYCLQWNQWLLWLNAASDLLIAMAYFSIPLALLFFVEKRGDFKYKRIFVLFAAFILLCGTTHLLGAIILWEPFYYLDTAVKMATATVSVYTAVVLWPLLPELLAFPSQSDFEAAERRYRESASLLQSVLDAIPSSVFWKDTGSRYLGCNRKHAANIGLASPGEIIGKTDYDFFPLLHAEKYRADDAKIMRSGESVIGYEEPYVGPNGDTRYASTTKVPLLDAGNTVIGIVAAYDDITDRKNAENELKEANLKIEERERYFRTLFNAIDDPIFIHEFPVGKFIDVNDAVCKVMGYTVEEFRQMTPIDVDDPQFTPEMMPPSEVTEAVQSGRSVTFERRHLKKDGEVIPVELHTRLFEYHGRNVVISIARNISGRKQNENALKQSQLVLTSLFNAISESVFIMDINGIVKAINKTGAARLGMVPADLVGKDIFSLIPADAKAYRMERITKCIITGEPLRFEDKRGDIWFNQVLYPVKDESGSVYMIAVFAMDITDRVNAEEAVKRTMAELEHVNAELRDFLFVSSHDLQEPLRKISGYIGLLKEHLSSAADDATLGYLDRMFNASRRMQTLIVDLLELSRIITRARPFGKVDLGMVMRQVIDDLEIQVKECNAIVEVALDGTIEADATQIRQLFQNLLSNALKFRKEDVPSVIHVSSSHNAAPTDILGTHYAIGELLVIHIADNGIGFQPKYAEKIFGLFQRLHRLDQYGGTGVGLAICKKIVERHKGDIIAEGNPGEGAVFTISLPIRQLSKGESMGGFLGESDKGET